MARYLPYMSFTSCGDLGGRKASKTQTVPISLCSHRCLLSYFCWLIHQSVLPLSRELDEQMDRHDLQCLCR